jgi:hypothetical protein
MANFDSAMRESCTVRESRTNTPLQALNLMNDVTFVEAARAMAQRVIREAAPEGRLELAYKLVLGRSPNTAEEQKLRNALGFYRQHFASNQDAAEKLIRQGESIADTAIPKAELASWTTICSLVLNLDEAVTKE